MGKNVIANTVARILAASGDYDVVANMRESCGVWNMDQNKATSPQGNISQSHGQLKAYPFSVVFPADKLTLEHRPLRQ
jgi:hypothetical protein